MLNQSFYSNNLLNSSFVSKTTNYKTSQAKKQINLKSSSSKKANQKVKQHMDHAPIMPKKVYKIESDDETRNEPIKSTLETP